MAAAKIGVSHWATHVQAQTDANAGKISSREDECQVQEDAVGRPG